jgi:hypothetical protein
VGSVRSWLVQEEKEKGKHRFHRFQRLGRRHVSLVVEFVKPRIWLSGQTNQDRTEPDL